MILLLLGALIGGTIVAIYFELYITKLLGRMSKRWDDKTKGWKE
jgi:hypothetical protein